MNNWEQIKEIVSSALELDPSQRDQHIRQACGSDEELRREVESLLRNCDGASGLLEAPAAMKFDAYPSETLVGRKIGVYRLVKICGRGGMAVVFQAERDDQQFRKRVAIKIVQPGNDSEEILRRFYNERQTLAALDHPNIVKLLDGGSTEEGWPYLVMEYVEGIPIDQYCDVRRLSVTERLELFRSVCAAVQHAHQNLVIHRDLKPGNILVTADGLPRLLDFGIAKLLNPQYAHAPLVTRADWRPLTPEYASPEQIRGETITTASDIYSLGVLLYRLLCGRRPYRQTANSWLDIVRQVCDEEVERPSTALCRADHSEDAGEILSVVAISDARKTRPEDLRRRLLGDLDNIVLKALRKEPRERYSSAEQLSTDIGNHLRHVPVLAAAGGSAYRLRKYLRRHRFGVATAACLVTLLAAFAVLQTVQLHRITRERDRANRITDFMMKMFKVSDPSEARGNSVTAREILDKAATDIGKGLAADPALQAKMMYVMGQVYDGLGLYSTAGQLLQSAYDEQQRSLGPDDADTLRTARTLGWNLERRGHDREAGQLQDKTLQASRRVFGKDNIETLIVTNDLIWTLQGEGQYAQAEQLGREALALERRALGAENPVTLQVMSNLGWILTHQHEYAEAEKLLQDTVDIRRRILGADNPETLSAMNNLGITLRHEKRLAEAEQLYREMLGISRRVMGPEHPFTMRAMNNLANVVGDEKRYGEKETLHRQILEVRLRTLGPDHPETLSTMTNLADALAAQGRYSDADKFAREALSRRERILGPNHPDTADSEYALVAIDAATGKRDEAFNLLRSAIDHGFGPDDDLGIGSDPALSSLHGDPRFAEVVAYARQRAETLRRR